MVEILKDEVNHLGVFKNSKCGFVAVPTAVGTFPAVSVERPLGGMYLINEMPDCDEMRPAPFVPGSRDALDKTFKWVKNYYGKGFPEIVAAWETFSTITAPQTDDACEYVATNPHLFDIPFQKELFSR